MAFTVIVPRRREDFFDDNDDPTLRYIRFLESLTSQTNVSSEDIEVIQAKEFEIISTTESLTTSAFQIIICKNVTDISIELDPDAIENDEVHIKRRLGTVNVLGLIDGLTDKIININNYSMHLVFDGDDWSEI